MFIPILFFSPPKETLLVIKNNISLIRMMLQKCKCHITDTVPIIRKIVVINPIILLH